VDVVLIEPGLIKTHFGDTAAGTMATASQTGGAYDHFNRKVAEATVRAYEGPLAKLGGGPEAVARVIDRALSAARPRARYLVTPSARLAIAQRRLTPDRVWDMFMRAQFPQPGKS
jgi:hypothetical protein